MNILIKLMSVVSLVLAPWFVRLHADDNAETTLQTVVDFLTRLLG
jgi:hypothetical protein